MSEIMNPDPSLYEQEPLEEAQPQANALEMLQALLAAPNIVEVLEDDELSSISQRALTEYEIDCESRKEWEERVDEAMDLAMLVSEEKNYPFRRASNVKYPLLTNAALQFNARAYPAVAPGNSVAKCKTWGKDPDGAKAARSDRVSEYMSYQLMAEMIEWEEDTDRMLVYLPIVGAVFRKVYHDPSLGRNVSRMITADRLVVNYHARSLEDVPRITERIYLYPYEIAERVRDGRFIEFKYSQFETGVDDEDNVESASDNESAPHLFLEQHRLLDLDDDGYPEPYVVTIHKATGTVCRIVANYTPETVRMSADGGRVASIRRHEYYVRYQFLPSPDGGFYGWGFGWLLKDITESINTALNQMLDAGHLANIQGGLVSSSLGIKEKNVRLEPGEWKVVNTAGNIAQSVMPIKYDGPNATLFALLGMLVETGKDIASIKDVLTGENRPNETATGTLALIEQGLQVYTSIYKRVHRALKTELGILARLNRDYLEPEKYNALFDDQQAHDPKVDFSQEDMDILPVSDPQVATRMQEMAKAEFIWNTAQQNPLINQEEALRRLYHAAQVDDIDSLIVQPEEPDPMVQALTEAMAKLELQGKEAEVMEKMTKAFKNIAEAEAAEEGAQLGMYDMFLKALQQEMSAEHQMQQQEVNGQGRIPGMEGQPGNPMGI